MDDDIITFGVANSILNRMDMLNCECTHLKLQQLLYLAHREYLIIRQDNDVDVLFPSKIEIWERGRVVPCVYKELKNLTSSIINRDVRIVLMSEPRDHKFRIPTVNIEQKTKHEAIDRICEKYGTYRTGELICLQ